MKTDRENMGHIAKNGKAPGDGSFPDMPQDEIGNRLRAMYAEVENEPIPAELLDLLEKLDAAEKRDEK